MAVCRWHTSSLSLLSKRVWCHVSFDGSQCRWQTVPNGRAREQDCDRRSLSEYEALRVCEPGLSGDNGPSCLCTAIDSDNAQLSCELKYGEERIIPTHAAMTWYDASGNQVFYEEPTSDQNNPNYDSSASAYSITSSGAASYTCGVTFTAPLPGAVDNMATNAPSFTASCTVANCVKKTATTPSSNSQFGPVCSSNQQLKNTVVFEGNSSSFFNQIDLNNVKWEFVPSNDPYNNLYTVADDNSVQSPFIGVYTVTPTQLSIPTTSIYPQSSDPYSASGLYTLTYKTNGCQSMANLIAVSHGPVCQCTATNSSNAVLSCEVKYGTARNLPNRAKMTWATDCGQVSSETPEPNESDPIYTVSTSTYSITSSGACKYTCGVTFNAPDSGTLANMAANAPTFYASCTIANCVKP